ncbi:unnamed protein product [Cuscuta campestris]|uniref:Gibberellin-regulated protein 6 n=1 Tax=Cuscuta campestris TaxID=132261 RepID=A0A484LJL9_9ASTE|nr:unnamed protein product [Cuscuta campestris]
MAAANKLVSTGGRSLVLIVIFVITVAALSSSSIAMAAAAAAASNAQPSNLDLASYGAGSLRPSQCLPQCTRRCSKTQYHKACMFFCQKCCNKCLCVPPGFYGNKSVCPCYNNWKTQQGGPKCP